MACELQQYFADVAAQVPDTGGARWVVTAQSLPRPPATLTTDRLVVRKGVQTYDACYRTDHLTFYAQPLTYRVLGLLILADLFHPAPEDHPVTVRLAHPASEIQALRLPAAGPPTFGYVTRPYAFVYCPQPTATFPWTIPPRTPRVLPCFWLTGEEMPITEVQWQQRAVVEGFGGEEGSVRLAELLLNASRVQNPITAYRLEGDAGVRGVGHLSAEATLLLPGDAAWNPTYWT